MSPLLPNNYCSSFNWILNSTELVLDFFELEVTVFELGLDFFELELTVFELGLDFFELGLEFFELEVKMV